MLTYRFDINQSISGMWQASNLRLYFKQASNLSLRKLVI